MIPSLEIREHAAKLYTEVWDYSEKLHAAEDNGTTNKALDALEGACAEAWRAYSQFCNQNDFALLTEASGSVLRCAETNIPLVDSDECVETETGQLMIVKQAA